MLPLLLLLRVGQPVNRLLLLRLRLNQPVNMMVLLRPGVNQPVSLMMLLCLRVNQPANMMMLLCLRLNQAVNMMQRLRASVWCVNLTVLWRSAVTNPVDAFQTATHLAIYHHLECDLYLHLAYRAQAPAVRTAQAVTQVALAQFEKGDTWERVLLESLEQRDVLTRVDDQGVLSGDEIGQLFIAVASMDEDTYISGLSFTPPSFEEEFAAHGTRPVQFSQAKPDLIKLRRGQPTSLSRRNSRGPQASLGDPDQVIFWEVIDAKSSSRVKTSHHVQIGFYARCLEKMLPEELDGVRFMSDTASIWLPPLGSSLQSIPLAHIFSALEDLIFRRLPEIVHGPEAKVQWHFNPLCSSCPWMQRCKTNVTRQSMSLSSL